VVGRRPLEPGEAVHLAVVREPTRRRDEVVVDRFLGWVERIGDHSAGGTHTTS
jgi:hypothetical protein